MARYRFNRSTLLEMAVAVEESARSFYSALSRRFPEHHSTFTELADDEKEHAETYKRLLASGREVYTTDEDRVQADRNLQVLEDTGLFETLRRGAEKAEETSDLKSALEAALQLEKDTLLFYYSMAMILADREDRESIYGVINVEYTHLEKVRRLLS